MRVAIAIALAGCGFRPGAEPADGGVDELAPDAIADETCVSWDALDASPCDAALGTPISLALGAGSYTLDADAGVLTGATTQTLPGALVAQTGGPTVRVVNLLSLSLSSGASVVVAGAHPVVVVVHGDATIDGTLDASALADGSVPGPGGDDTTSCASGTGVDGVAASDVGGGGGAGGGGFGDNAGDGGDGQGAGHGGHGGHGAASGAPTLVPLRAGCGGGRGGDAFPTLGAGYAGHGGGGIAITARGRIDVRGTIASGGSGGGTPAMVRGGGGGGGSGGAIVIDGDAVSLLAGSAVCANGGGGGEGGQLAATSQDGAPGACTTAGGGAMDPDGGDGGNGGAGAMTKGMNGAAGARMAGGGGGGGAVGRIRVRGRTARSIDPGAVVMPAAAP